MANRLNAILKRQDEILKNAIRFESKPVDKSHDGRRGKQFADIATLYASGVCAICGSARSVKRNLSLDHCHKTGELRGVLCHNCNVGLGHFKDDADLLRRAVDYLDAHVARSCAA